MSIDFQQLIRDYPFVQKLSLIDCIYISMALHVVQVNIPSNSDIDRI